MKYAPNGPEVTPDGVEHASSGRRRARGAPSRRGTQGPRTPQSHALTALPAFRARVPMPPVQPLTAPRPPLALALPRLGAGRLTALAVLLLTALTFLAPSAPTYDPWAWIVWGREVAHLDLSTVDGPSWKPLPVLVTTLAAPAGGLAPDLWLFVARAGAIAGVVLAYRVGRRLGGVPAGVVAAGTYALAPWNVRNAAMGNSEGLLVALALGAVDRHAAGAHRAAFACGLGVALLRPEAWPILALYAAWLWRHDGGRSGLRWLVVAGLAALPVLWLLPELWGSGDALRAMHRAKDPRANSPAFAEDPVGEVLRQFADMLTASLWLGLGALGALAIALRAPGRRELRLAGALVAVAGVWVAEVAVMTSDGFSGNTRYLILPAALACVLAGAVTGWTARAVAPRLPGRHAAAVLAAGALLAFAGPWGGAVDRTLTSVSHQARLTDGLGDAVRRAGGAERLLACGQPFTGPFQVPAVAWRLGVHTTRVGLRPRVPGVALRAANRRGGTGGPALAGLGGEGAVRTFAIASGWRIVGNCGGGAS
jgi:hypothetical protein